MDREPQEGPEEGACSGDGPAVMAEKNLEPSDELRLEAIRRRAVVLAQLNQLGLELHVEVRHP